MDEERICPTVAKYLRRNHENLVPPEVAERRGLTTHKVMHGNEEVITHAECLDGANLTRLYKSEVIEACHVDTGMLFTTMRMVALKKLDTAKLDLGDVREHQ